MEHTLAYIHSHKVLKLLHYSEKATRGWRIGMAESNPEVAWQNINATSIHKGKVYSASVDIIQNREGCSEPETNSK